MYKTILTLGATRKSILSRSNVIRDFLLPLIFPKNVLLEGLCSIAEKKCTTVKIENRMSAFSVYIH